MAVGGFKPGLQDKNPKKWDAAAAQKAAQMDKNGGGGGIGAAARGQSPLDKAYATGQLGGGKHPGFGAERDPSGNPISSAPVAPAAAAPGAIQGPGIPDIDAYLMGDTAYQGGMSSLSRELGDFTARNQAERNTVQGGFDTALDRMRQGRTRALENIKEDFGARGLLNSGLYSQAQGDYENTYNQQVGDLTSDNNSSLNALLEALQQQTGLNTTSQQSLRDQAVARRAQQYGITS